MKRAARLLLWVLVGWLLALPLQRVERVRVLVRAPAAAAFERRTTDAVEHVVVESGTPRVAAAPLRARLPAPSFSLRSPTELGAPSALSLPRDLRQALRRVQTRRRLPRLSSGDPPWR